MITTLILAASLASQCVHKPHPQPIGIIPQTSIDTCQRSPALSEMAAERQRRQLTAQRHGAAYNWAAHKVSDHNND